jgi:hypothetical protein
MKLALILIFLLIISGIVLSVPYNQKKWCNGNPSFKPGCVQFNFQQRYYLKEISKYSPQERELYICIMRQDLCTVGS